MSLAPKFLPKIKQHRSTKRMDFSVEDSVGVAVAKISAPALPGFLQSFLRLLKTQEGMKAFFESRPKRLACFLGRLPGDPASLRIILKGTKVKAIPQEIQVRVSSSTTTAHVDLSRLGFL